MANYYGTFRSNYFKVTDAQKLKEIVSKMGSTDGRVELFEDNAPYYGFGGDGDIMGIWPETDDEKPTSDDTGELVDEDDLEYDFALMVQKLQDILVEDDAIIIMSSGHEKLRYVVGTAVVITKTTSEFLDVKELAKNTARSILRDENWDTVCEC